MGEHDADITGRKKYLPLDKLDKCALCQKASGKDVKLRLCTSCAETAYCSPECQKKDWKAHKPKCGTTDRVDIQSFYPLLAAIMHISHIHPDIQHPALNHKIINCPSPNGGTVVDFPDGSSARLVLLGEPFDQMKAMCRMDKWWPSAPTEKVRHKLLRRIASEGLVLPTVLATAIALVAEMYTTTAVPQSERPGWQVTDRRRVRLTHNRSPIADFGIIHGTVRVTPQDKLAYFNVDDPGFLMGQDPNDHYWMYFTTLAGDEYFLDCSMFTFNFCIMATADAYCRWGLPDLGFVPAFWFGREFTKAFPAMDKISWKPIKKFSILRESRLNNMLRSFEFDYCDCCDIQVFHSLLDEIAGRTSTAWEREMMVKFLPNACTILRLNMKNREYLKFPKEPALIIDADPGEDVGNGESDEEKALYAFLMKWSRRLKKGKISTDQWEAAFKAWSKAPHEARLKMVGSSLK